MLRTRISCLSKSRLRVLHTNSLTRSFLTSTKPVAARQKLSAGEVADRTVDYVTRKSWVRTPHRFQKQRRTSALHQALVLSIQSSEDQHAVTSRIMSDLHRFTSGTPHPHTIYENAIRFLMKCSCLPPVLALYEHMIAEGLIVSPSLEARILVAAISLTDGRRRKDFLSSLKKVVGNDSFTPDDLLKVLGNMSAMDMPPETLLQIMNIFHKSHRSWDSFEPDIRFYKKLVSSMAKDGNVQHALEALSILPQSDIDAALIPEAYVSFLSAIRQSPRPDRAAVTAALAQMQEQGIPITLAVWNNLIAYELRTNSLRRPFTIYAGMKENRELLPDDFTFGSLFSALNQFYNPKRRRYRNGVHLPDDIPTPRALFHEMIEALVRDPAAPPFELTTSLLHVVLRTFVSNKDYAAAYVALRAFLDFHVPVSVKTYLIIFRHMMNRITYGIKAVRKMGSVKWADRFLSLPYPITNPKFLSGLQLSNPLASNILDVSRRRTFRMDCPLYIDPHPPPELDPEHYQTPTVEGMLGREPVSVDQSFDAQPLICLLKKALLAEMELDWESADGHSTSLTLLKAIADVEQEMVPPRLSKRLKRMRNYRN